jgi:hypothetical protein
VKITRFITADAGIGYTHADYEENGTIGDRSDFDGISYSAGLKHNMNSRISHNIRVAHSITPGFGSNYDELTVAQYGINWKFNSYLTFTSTFAYDHLKASITGGERADRFLWHVGTSWEVARRWNLGLGYSYAWRESNLTLRDYQQNRVTLDLTHDF